LGAIKGLGRTVITHLLRVQDSKDPFQDLFELCRRIDSNKINRRALEALVHSGAFDSFGKARWVLSGEIELAMKAAAQQASAALAKQADLFGKMTAQLPKITQQSILPAWTTKEQCKREKAALGIYLKEHPLQQYKDELTHLRLVALSDVYQTMQPTFLCAAWLVVVRIKFTQRGDRFAILLLEDEKSRIELKLSHEQCQMYREHLIKDSLLVFELESYTNKARQESHVSVKQLWNAAGMRQKWGRCLKLRIIDQVLSDQGSLVNRLQQHLQPATGGTCSVVVEYHASEAIVPLVLGEAWKVKPGDELLEVLQAELGSENVWMEYQ
jgi:DNA polymerase-3 subunit alpha